MKEKSRVILPGSYDPVTLGHLDLIRRASETYEEVLAVIFINPDKKYTFSLEDRMNMLTLATEDFPNVRTDCSSGFVVDYMRKNGIDKIVKGYRNDIDLEYEKIQAEYNYKHGGYETVLLPCADDLAHVSSTLAREILEMKGDASEILPEKVILYINKH